MGEDRPAHAPSAVARSGPVVLVVSPHAGHGDADTPRKALESAGVTIGEQIVVSELDHRLPQGTAWRERGIVAVVAAGGDGTVGAVATQVAGSGLPMGILPLGTSNDVARALGVPLGLAAASKAFSRGMPVDMDVGQVLPARTEPGAMAVDASTHEEISVPSAQDSALATHGACFVHAVTLGLNVSFARLATDVARRQRWGGLTYATSALEAVSQFEPVPVTLRLSGARTLDADGIWRTAQGDLEVMCRVVQVAVVNTPTFGGAMNLRIPDVDMHDRMLDFLLIEALEPPTLRKTIEGLVEAVEKLGVSFQSRRRSRTGTAETAIASANQQDPAHVVMADELAVHLLPGVRRYRAISAVLRTPQHVDVTLDGEIRAHTPVLVRIAPEPLQIVLPPRAGAPEEPTRAR
ncbi:MAG TPA: diacylglycerol kinase family protein [Ktedonobacterales bacterium]|nr:diacylglycerol kinase family protein [Ktedonobacterales bacterium]